MDKLFDTKRKYIGYDGEEYINMCIPAVDTNKISVNSTVIINQDDNGRIDKFTWCDVAHNMNMIDTVMYANHIFNPFSIQDGDMYNIPVDNDNMYVSTDEPSLPNGTKHSSNVNGEKKKTYAENVEYLAKMGLGVR